MWVKYGLFMDERWADRRTELLSNGVESYYAGGRTNRWAGELNSWLAELLYIFIYKVKYLRKIFNFFYLFWVKYQNFRKLYRMILYKTFLRGGVYLWEVLLVLKKLMIV